MKISYIPVGNQQLPNLAIMKHAGYMHEKGHDVVLNQYGNVDRYFASVVFDKDKKIADALKNIHGDKCDVGGSGYDIELKMPEEIEKRKPLYELYGINYGLGFTSRGCIRNCKFCVVPKKEGMIHSVSTVAELVNPKSNFLVLLDNNFLASPDWEERCKEIYTSDYKVSFCQGFDIRLVNDHNAEWLSKIKLRNLHNTSNTIYFAWDDIKLEKQVKEGVRILEKNGIKKYRLRFYILCGFNSTFGEDRYRVEEIISLGCEPYVMLYNKGNSQLDQKLKDLQRWANRPELYKTCTFDEYKPFQKKGNANQVM